jgi:NADH-quinone oxidoreductase subunit C
MTELSRGLEIREGAFGVKGSPDTSGYGGLRQVVSEIPAAEPPYGEWFDKAMTVLQKSLAKKGIDSHSAIEKVMIYRGELTLMVGRDHLLAVMQSLRDEDELSFEVCLGVTGVHWPQERGREIHVNYPLLSMLHNRRLNVEVALPVSDPRVDSVTSVYPGNNWHERETYDFFGVVFLGHPGLTRILMPDDWPGFPQRKDYPLSGVDVEYKGAIIPPPDERRWYT